MDKKKWGFGGLLVLAGGWFGRETISWLFGKLLDAITAGKTDSLSLATFPWENVIGLILMGLGLYLILKSDKRAERNEDLSMRMGIIFSDLDDLVRMGPNAAFHPNTMGEATAIGHELEGIGISTPYCIDLDVPSTYRALHTFFGALRPMVRANQIALAKKEAPRSSRALECRKAARDL